MEIKLGRTQYQITSISMESALLKIILTCQNTQEIVLLLNAEEAQTLVKWPHRSSAFVEGGWLK